MALLDRDRIWWTAWAAIPFAMLIDFTVAGDAEKAIRLQGQGAVHAEHRSWERAAALFEEAARVDPGSAPSAHNASVAFARLGDRERARRWNREALRRDPDFAPARSARKALARPAGDSAGGG